MLNKNYFAEAFAQYLTDPETLKKQYPADYAFFDAVSKGYNPLDIQFVDNNGKPIDENLYGTTAIIKDYSADLAKQNAEIGSKTWNDVSPQVQAQNQGYRGIVEQMSTKYNVPVGIIVGVMQNESGAESDREKNISNDGYGSVGLMQVIPGGGYSAEILMNPSKNIEAGTSLLRAIYDDPSLGNGNWRDTIALYNTGDWFTLLNKPIISTGGYAYADSVLTDAGINPADLETNAPTAPKPPSNIFNNDLVNTFTVFQQKDGPSGSINRAGGTMITDGDGPSTAYNVLNRFNKNPNINNIVGNFLWSCGAKNCGSSADAVLLSLQSNGFTGAVDYGEHNKITDTQFLYGYTGVLVYGGTANVSGQNLAHIAAFDCQDGSCAAIDSSLTDGKPAPCDIKSSTIMSCGSITYHIGKTQGTPDALFPVQSP